MNLGRLLGRLAEIVPATYLEGSHIFRGTPAAC